ncbi:DNA adenine methylase [bacterium]|nr:DNA adenine methylase [bacterium]
MSARIKSPIQWFGGKQAMAAKLLPLFPEHRTYVEPFGGGGSLLICKEPSPVEVYNDLDADLVNFFHVLRDPALFPDFYNRAWLSPFSREEYLFCRDHLNDDPSPAERARRFFVLARFSFSGLVGKSFGINVTSSSGGMVEKVSAYRNILCALPLIAERLSRAEIECRDFRQIIRIYDRPETFFYLDPPYVPSTRKCGGYRHEMTEQDHQELVELLRGIQGKAMLSGYPNELYDSLGWQQMEWQVNCSAVGRTRATGLQGAGAMGEAQKRVERVWMNYEP